MYLPNLNVVPQYVWKTTQTTYNTDQTNKTYNTQTRYMYTCISLYMCIYTLVYMYIVYKFNDQGTPRFTALRTGMVNLVYVRNTCMWTSPDVRDWVRDAMREGLSPRQILLPLLGPQCLPVRWSIFLYSIYCITIASTTPMIVVMAEEFWWLYCQ